MSAIAWFRQQPVRARISLDRECLQTRQSYRHNAPIRWALVCTTLVGGRVDWSHPDGNRALLLYQTQGQRSRYRRITQVQSVPALQIPTRSFLHLPSSAQQSCETAEPQDKD